MATVAILSGRYEIPHAAHVRTIRREAANYDRLIVYIVDRPGRPYPTAWAKELLEMACEVCGNVEFRMDPCHFGYATKEDIERLPAHDVFLCGNPKVAGRLMTMGVNVKMIEETPGYHTSDIESSILRQALTSWGKVTDSLCI